MRWDNETLRLLQRTESPILDPGDLVTKREGAVGLRSAIEYVLSIDVILLLLSQVSFGIK